jgi:hypothetical protein
MIAPYAKGPGNRHYLSMCKAKQGKGYGEPQHTAWHTVHDAWFDLGDHCGPDRQPLWWGWVQSLLLCLRVMVHALRAALVTQP